MSTSLLAVGYCAGNYMFLMGYADTTLDVKTARYQKGGGIKMLSLMGVFFTCCASCYAMLK